VERFRRAFPERPVVLAMTGTDLYRDIRRSRRARRALEAATRVVVLQPLGLRELSREVRGRARVVHQSVAPVRVRPEASRRHFDVCVIGHLRWEKDPFRAALAARRLPSASRIRVLHVGKALGAAMERRVRGEERRNFRYRWLGERPRNEARRLLARSRLMVLSSRMEGGANVISEALAARVPILASRIPGSVGLLGTDYPGLFPTGDTAALVSLLWRAETDARFLARLARACRRRARIVSPAREREAWRRLLREIGTVRRVGVDASHEE
jgi:putative glycosyltransferase (TIGR04348 family)